MLSLPLVREKGTNGNAIGAHIPFNDETSWLGIMGIATDAGIDGFDRHPPPALHFSFDSVA